MYQSLYRKYRPRHFDEVIGQQVIVKTLKNTILNHRLGHAYLFTGPRGTGKTSIAKIFAKTINCSQLKNTTPCDNCESCQQILNKKSVDIVEIDAASNNGVDEIRELRSKANLVPTVGKYKVYIIDEVHMLTTGAFNALLKTLEEPPSHVVFILATTEPHKIPATIISRCQRFDFKKIAQGDMIAGLKKIAQKEQIIIDEKAYVEIAKQSDGCMRDALSILDQVIAFSDGKITINHIHEINGTLPEEQLILFLQNILLSEYEQIFATIEEYDTLGKNYIKLAEDLIYILRNILLQINIPNYEVEEENRKLYHDIIKYFNLEQIMNYIKIINNYLFEIKKTNHPRIIFEMLIISLMQQNEEKNIESSIQEKRQEEKPVITEITPKEEIKPQEEKKVSIEKENLQKTKPLKQKNMDFPIDKIRNLQQIRINNTLFAFNKQKMLEKKNKIEEVRNLLVDVEYSDYASIILDAEIKCASEDHILFLSKTKTMELEFLKNLPRIDETLEKIYGKKIFSIPVNQEDWLQIKNEFNQKTKKYEFIEEPPNIKDYFKNGENSLSIIDKWFEDIVEYS